MTSLLWLRRDLRLGDHPALHAAAESVRDAAAEEGGPLTLLWVVDPDLWRRAGRVPRAWTAANVLALADRLDGRLRIEVGDPVDVVPDVAAEIEADLVHVSAETTPYGAQRDARVDAALRDAGRGLRAVGSPYAVGPGLVRNGSGDPYQVFTPFAKAWRSHGWPDPAPTVRLPDLAATTGAAEGVQMLRDAAVEVEGMPTPGEEAALRRWRRFRDDRLDGYASARDLPAVAGTTGLSPYLKVGAIHPRTLLADLTGKPGPTSADARSLIDEVAWREFYADVLHHHPHSAWRDLKPLRMPYDDPDDARDLLVAWQQGRTGFPIVDAGMRQLAATGWMHNRVRMITASFFCKDLHLWWPTGARFFFDALIDADLASNSHGWQWVAGTGTDASPYFRVFNPITQGKRFDPEGDYVRRWVPELVDLPGNAAHEPWKHGGAPDYPEPILDHAAERIEALDRYQARG